MNRIALALALTLAVPSIALAEEPLLSDAPAWSAIGTEMYDFFGESIAMAGDVDGDGFDDVIVGAPNADTSQEMQNDGKAYLFRGGPSGLETTPSWQAKGSEWNAEFGAAVAAAGDVNGDGFDDVLVGAHWANTASLWLGASSGPKAAPDWTHTDTTDSFAEYGISVAGIGDVNDDGYDDIAIGACYCGALEGNGRVFVYFGSAGGIVAEPLVIEGGSDVQFGISVARAGDVNGDGFGDLLVGADYAPYVNDANGEAYLYLGGITGPASQPAWTVRGENGQDRFGYAMAASRDFTGDGKPDIAIGAHNYGAGSAGRVQAFAGGESLATSAAWTADGPMEGASLGYALANAGDLNGDGFDDLVSGGDTYSNGENGEGAAFVFLGGPGAGTAPAWSREGGSADGAYGAAVAGGGDVNGDGAFDVLVAAPYWSDAEGAYRGRVELFTGLQTAGPGPDDKPADPAEGAAEGCACSLGRTADSAGAVWPSVLVLAAAVLAARRRER